MRDDGGSDQGYDSGTREKRSDSEQILKVRPTGFLGQSNEGWKKKQGVRLWPEQLEGMKSPPPDLGKNIGKAGLGKKIWSLVLDM